MNAYKIELKRGFKNGNVNDTATFDIVIYDVESEKRRVLSAKQAGQSQPTLGITTSLGARHSEQSKWRQS